jgi:hypothetical protein
MNPQLLEKQRIIETKTIITALLEGKFSSPHVSDYSTSQNYNSHIPDKGTAFTCVSPQQTKLETFVLVR